MSIVYEGYCFNPDKSGRILRCSKRKKGCPAVLEKNEVGYSLRTDHKYSVCGLRSKATKNNKKARFQMLRMARKTCHDPAYIYKKVMRRFQKQGRIVDLKLENMRQAIKRLRRTYRPLTSKSFEKLGNDLQTYDAVGDIYVGPVKAEDGSIPLLFTSEKLRAQLDKVQEIFMDGTFDITPRQPYACQCYIIHMYISGKGVGTIFALCTRRTTLMYNSIFKKLKEICPHLEENLKHVTGDFESAAIKSVKECFKFAKYHGCWFHFKKALRKKWKSLGLRKYPELIEFLEMLLAIPLLPADQIENAIRMLKLKIFEYNEYYHKMLQKYMRYVQRQWMKKADVVSVEKLIQRTNNISESFNSTILERVGGKHPNELKTVFFDEEIKMDKLLKGEKVGSQMKKKDRIRNKKIRKAQDTFKNGGSTELFLKQCSPNFEA